MLTFILLGEIIGSEIYSLGRVLRAKRNCTMNEECLGIIMYRSFGRKYKLGDDMAFVCSQHHTTTATILMCKPSGEDLLPRVPH